MLKSALVLLNVILSALTRHALLTSPDSNQTFWLGGCCIAASAALFKFKPRFTSRQPADSLRSRRTATPRTPDGPIRRGFDSVDSAGAQRARADLAASLMSTVMRW